VTGGDPADSDDDCSWYHSTSTLTIKPDKTFHLHDNGSKRHRHYGSSKYYFDKADYTGIDYQLVGGDTYTLYCT